jgi:hypothetical protein
MSTAAVVNEVISILRLVIDNLLSELVLRPKHSFFLSGKSRHDSLLSGVGRLSPVNHPLRQVGIGCASQMGLVPHGAAADTVQRGDCSGALKPLVGCAASRQPFRLPAAAQGQKREQVKASGV